MKNWCWLRLERGMGDQHWKATFERMREAGVDAILPEVFDNHAAWWASKHLPVAEPLLERLIPLAHEAGLEITPGCTRWRVISPRSSRRTPTGTT